MRVIKVSIAKGFVIDGDKPSPQSKGVDLSQLKQITEGLINNQTPEVPQALEPIAESIKLIIAKIDNLPKGGSQSVEPEYVSEIGEITFNANSYPFTDNKVMFQNAFTDIPYIDVMIAYTDSTIPSAYFSYALYDVDKSGFKCRMTGVHANRNWVAKYKATGKVK